MELTPRRRRALSTALALVLAVESVSVVAAAGLRASARPLAPAPASEPAPALGMSSAEAAAVPTDDERLVVPDPAATGSPGAVASQPPTRPADAASPQVQRGVRETTTARVPIDRLGPGSTVALKGRNHVWIPSLGVNRSVSWFPCDRSRAPDNLVYRWGCAGANNVYLLGHAYGVFKPLHDAYASGRLRKGLRAYYADARGRIHSYRVRWWRVTAPTTAASWAWAAQSAPSMTLQTCVGKNSAYRLMVRLVEVKG